MMPYRSTMDNSRLILRSKPRARACELARTQLRWTKSTSRVRRSFSSVKTRS